MLKAAMSTDTIETPDFNMDGLGEVADESMFSSVINSGSTCSSPEYLPESPANTFSSSPILLNDDAETKITDRGETHSDDRVLTPEEYEYGIGNDNQANAKLFVFEPNDRQLVRIYVKILDRNQNEWHCGGCARIDLQCFGIMDGETFYAPIRHHCTPLSYEKVNAIQQQIKEKFKSPSLSNVAPIKPGSSTSPQQIVLLKPVIQRQDVVSRNPPQIRSIELGKRPSTSLYRINNNKPSSSSPMDYQRILPRIIVPKKRYDDSFPSPSTQASSSRDSTNLSVKDIEYMEIASDKWEYGYDSNGCQSKRIIVHDCEDDEYVHEFRNDANDHRCLSCKSKVAAKFEDSRLLVPTLKSHTCQPRLYAEVEKLQEQYAKRGGRKRPKSIMYRTRQKRRKDEEVQNDSNFFGGLFEDEHSWNTPATVKPATFTPRAIVNPPTTFNTPATMTIYKPLLPRKHANSSSTVAFFNPSAYILTQWCKKMDIRYSNDAYKFWSQIGVEEVSPESRPRLTFQTTEERYHGFSCLSLFLTGNESNASVIREMLNRYVYENFKTLGKCLGYDFSKFTHESSVIRDTLWSFSMTDVHAECLSRWLQCRIGIFDGHGWKRFGVWDAEEADENDTIPTLLMEETNGKFKPILSF